MTDGRPEQSRGTTTPAEIAVDRDGRITPDTRAPGDPGRLVGQVV